MTAVAHAVEPSDAMEPAHCGATTRQSGLPCRKGAGWGTDHLGFGRCKLHGGATPNHRKHYLRLVESLVPDAVRQLRRLVVAGLAVESDIPEHVRLRAAQDILDRAGLGARQVHEHGGLDGGPIPVEVRVAELLDRVGQLSAGVVVDTTRADADDPDA